MNTSYFVSFETALSEIITILIADDGTEATALTGSDC